MIILDENFPESQRQLLRSWRVRFRQIGFEIGQSGLKDHLIIPFLHHLTNPTFFTLDHGFDNPRYLHAGYCLVHLDVGQYEAAVFVRRVLQHKDFNTQAKRMGTVMRVSQIGLTVWKPHAKDALFLEWT
jgi:hypothetical protein